MTMGPEPMIITFLMSSRRGIQKSPLVKDRFVQGGKSFRPMEV